MATTKPIAETYPEESRTFRENGSTKVLEKEDRGCSGLRGQANSANELLEAWIGTQWIPSMIVVQQHQASIALFTGFLDCCKGFIVFSQRRSYASNDPTHALASRAELYELP